MRGFHLKAWRGFATCPIPTPAQSGGMVPNLGVFLYNRILLARRSGRSASRYAHAPHSTPGMGESLPGTMGRQLPLRGRFTSFWHSTSASRKVECLPWANLLPELWIVHFRFAEGRRSRSAQVLKSQESGRNLGKI